MEKVILTKEQEKAIKYWMNDISLERDEYEKKADFLQIHAEDDNGWEGKAKALNEISFSNLAKALYIGYVVVETPEEKLLRQYTEARETEDTACKERNDFQEGWGKGFQRGIESALKELGKKIKGINE